MYIWLYVQQLIAQSDILAYVALNGLDALPQHFLGNFSPEKVHEYPAALFK